MNRKKFDEINNAKNDLYLKFKDMPWFHGAGVYSNKPDKNLIIKVLVDKNCEIKIEEWKGFKVESILC